MCEAENVSLQASLAVVGALECVVGRCVGPVAGSVLFTKDTGETLITRHGQRILTSLHLEHPIARMVLDCVCAHDRITADGSKSFILLLAALLRGIRDSVNRRSKTSWNPAAHRKLANQLLAFCSCELDHVISHTVVPNASALLGVSGYRLKCGVLPSLVGGYVAGRTNAGQAKILTSLLCELYRKVSGGRNSTLMEPITFLHSNFSLLHVSLSGLPIDCSQVIEGLVLACDWSVLRETKEPVKALVVWESLDKLWIASDENVRVSLQQDWMHQVEILMKQRLEMMLSLQVRVVLSKVKQPECVLSWAQLNDVSVLECCDSTQLDFLCDITSAETLPAQPLQRVAVLKFYGRLQLGGVRCALLRAPSHGELHIHTLVLCSPCPGSLEQNVCASQGVFTMLHHLCQSVVQSDEVQWREKHTLSDTSTHQMEREGVCQTPERPPAAPHVSSPLPDRSQTCPGGSQIPASAEDLWDVILKEGGVLPVGGAFEFLMHHSLLQCGNHGDSESRRLLAEAILSVPRSLHSHKNRSFLHSHAEFMNKLQLLKQRHCISELGSGSDLTFGSGLTTTNYLCVEPVCSKYQLVVSVLQCLNRLLCVGTILTLHTSVPLHKSLTNSSQDSEEEMV